MSLPVEIVYGIYLGVLTGVVPALVAGALGFVFKYVTGVTIPGLGVVVLALAIAGINGGLLALNDPTIRSAEHAPAILTAIVVVLMLSLYAHAQGDKLGASVPRRLSLRALRDRTLSTDVVELVGGRGQVRVTVRGDVDDMEGYPSLPAETQAGIAEGSWTFPADLPLSELEARLADRLRTEFDLADVAVTLDERARAAVSAAPPSGGLSKRVPAGHRAVSVEALLPTGLAQGDRLTLGTPGETVEGTLLSARSNGGPGPVGGAGDGADGPAPVADGGTDSAPDSGRLPAAHASSATTTGGEGRVTVAVERSDAGALLRATRGRIVVLSRGRRREFELTTLLKRAGKRFRRATVARDGPLDGTTIGAADVRGAYDVAILAARHDGGWRVAPRGDQELSAGDDLFIVGTREALDRFGEAAA